MTLTVKQLKSLREKYGNTSGGEMYDAKFKRIADLIFKDGDNRQAPYTGIPTLLDAPIMEVDADNPDFADLQVALFGVPMDLGVTNRTGARFGPRAVRTMERIGPYHEVLDCAPIHEMRVADIGDVPFRSRFSLEKSLADIEAHTQRIVDAGVIPIAVGGDHSITHPILRAIGQNTPVGMIHIDAHCDTGGSYEGEKFHHGGPFRNAVLDGVLDPTRCIQIGIRGTAEYVWEFSYASGMTVIHAKDISDMGISTIIDKARQIVGDTPTYLTFDVDGLDPVFAPGTGTPEVGGLSTREALALLRGLKGLNFVGGDVVEVAPEYDATTNTAQIGAQLLFEILSLMQFSPSLPRRV